MTVEKKILDVCCGSQQRYGHFEDCKNFKESPVPLYNHIITEEDIKHAAELANKSQIEQMEKWRVLEEVKKLITNEIAQAHLEGSPSKRLTSLFMKLEKI